MKQALTIAGFDSNGSAGLAADLHSFYADGVYGHGVLTGVVAENATAITASSIMPPSFIKEEFHDLAEFHITAAKTGMLANSATINVVAQRYASADFGPLVVDPVIITKRHDRLLSNEAFENFRKQIIPLATIITPNFMEAEELLGKDFLSSQDIIAGAHELQQMGAKNVVIKGQHDAKHNSIIHNYVLLADGTSFWLDNQFVKTKKLNGAGDSFSAIITAELAKGNSISNAIKRANHFVDVAIHHPLAIGQSFGPINHWAGEQSL
ncbi:bifunctional hydroxymethylpyrimidine kinase/phosphomethylpyrimidine kinase [uncultured Limosilactobacillus sp.]|uniref:bifunctional hydroxymethylpyrimidine kinase/phosphomethylpyrimidine kinase n=1 Tax=uncultured Limosilactobacillus sp. TaxID=2837629 RepID=UPI0025FE72C8|nr:bifunctional hydroxymethylpyrimidine kinase/phosphomethylpyrimidine kinase [uncultured Limosilactobacillus sp.]